MNLTSPFPLEHPPEKPADRILQLRHPDLLTACTRLAPFTRAEHPLLSCVRLDFAPQSLTLSGSNLEITARIQVPARCSGLAHLRLPLARLLKWLALPSPCTVLELRLYGYRLTLCRGDLSAELGVSLEVKDALELPHGRPTPPCQPLSYEEFYTQLGAAQQLEREDALKRETPL